MKKCLVILNILVLLFALTSCGKEDTNEKETTEIEIGNEVTENNTESQEVADEEEYFSMKVDGVYGSTEGTIVSGKIESGTVRANDQVEVINNGTAILATVLEVEINGEVVDSATVNDYAALVLQNIKKSEAAVGVYVTTPGQDTLDAAAEVEAENASVIHPPAESGENHVEYDINISNGEYIETTFCVIDKIEFVMGSEFGNNKIVVEEPKYESSMLAGLKAELTNTSDVTYNLGNSSVTVWSYITTKYTPGGPYDGILYVEKDGDLLENVEVAPGETVVIYMLGEIDYGWHEKYADELYVTFCVEDLFSPEDGAYYMFEIRDFDR